MRGRAHARLPGIRQIFDFDEALPPQAKASCRGCGATHFQTWDAAPVQCVQATDRSSLAGWCRATFPGFVSCSCASCSEVAGSGHHWSSERCCLCQLTKQHKTLSMAYQPVPVRNRFLRHPRLAKLDRDSIRRRRSSLRPCWDSGWLKLACSARAAKHLPCSAHVHHRWKGVEVGHLA